MTDQHEEREVMKPRYQRVDEQLAEKLELIAERDALKGEG